jgi:iron complex outermembrane recepter protein
MRSKISSAIASILGGVSAGVLAAQPVIGMGTSDANGTPQQVLPAPTTNAAASSSSDSTSLDEVVVTATRRSENIQDVPLSVKAITAESMDQLHISTFDDLVGMVPNLTSANNGPGQNELIMRGASAGTQPTQASGIIGLWPNVALYLDDQSVQLPSQNLDVYTVDLSRVEVLEGPQGTLFGSGAEAGAVRYITNKPVLDKVEANVSADYGVTAGGDPNTAVNAVLNLPIIPDHFAVRLVAYDDSRGGYINNVAGTFSHKDTDVGIHYANYPAVNGQCPDGGANNGFCVPPGTSTINNSSLVRNAINPVTYQGGRIEALYQINDDWDFLVTQMNQSMDAEGVSFQYPRAPDGQTLEPLEVVLFTPAYHKDQWSNTSWTLDGKAGPLSLIYTGGFLTRHTENQMDYTNYVRGYYGDYYQCYGPGSGGTNSLKSTCFTAPAAVISNQQNEHYQNEFRISTPATWRVHGVAGVYQEENVVYDQTYFNYREVPACTSDGPAGTAGNSGCFSVEGTFPGATVKSPGLQNPSTAFFNDAKRGENQISEFVSASVDLTPHLTLTAGTRHFTFTNSLVGVVQTGFGCFEAGVPTTGCHDPAFSTDLNAQNLKDTESGERSQAGISWNIDPILFGEKQHVLIYFNFSQGFRPGGFNQNVGSSHGLGPDDVPQFLVPAAYHSDSLSSYEIGWKTDWRVFDRRFQLNAAIYREDWNNVQIGFFDPGFTGTSYFDYNGQNFRIDGAETSFVAEIWHGLTFRGSSAWNKSEQTNSPSIIDNNPASVNYGKPITELCPSGPTSCTPFTNPFGPQGAPTANSPPLHYNLVLRDEFPIHTSSRFEYLNGAMGHVQIGMQHTGHSFTQAGANPSFLPGETITTVRLRFEDPAYSTLEASVGLSQNNWSLDFYGQNLSNSNAALYTSTGYFIEAQTPLRPRILGMKFTYTF